MDGILWNWPNEENERFYFIYLFFFYAITFTQLTRKSNSTPRLKNEASFKSFALEMGWLIIQDFKNEAYIPYTVIHIFVLSVFF